MEFSRQEQWNGLPCPTLGDLPDSRTQPATLALAGGFFTIEPHGKPSCQDQLLIRKLIAYMHDLGMLCK